MSIFRAAARVTSPDGVEWRIFAHKVTRPKRLRRLPRELLAALREDAWTIDAVGFRHHEVVHTWTTTGAFKGQVLAQVEGHLARGDVPVRLTNAVYRGESRSAR